MEKRAVQRSLDVEIYIYMWNDMEAHLHRLRPSGSSLDIVQVRRPVLVVVRHEIPGCAWTTNKILLAELKHTQTCLGQSFALPWYHVVSIMYPLISPDVALA